ncbi:hypothetical protein [Janthinobacterium sp. 17J80-10]|uniref:hypothetical protein n=1 Tax=Janthinobacterium sp. 17J80-10 TaxID=2497863 RepID=UPI0010057654|nr:hypothetical protein [Janthinobacterium sp. 17J80-10]QAU33061.1 hypothetical protein EKL02_02105 [Janthinobacterium sp. 17J80-10]
MADTSRRKDDAPTIVPEDNPQKPEIKEPPQPEKPPVKQKNPGKQGINPEQTGPAQPRKPGQ